MPVPLTNWSNGEPGFQLPLDQHCADLGQGDVPADQHAAPAEQAPVGLSRQRHRRPEQRHLPPLDRRARARVPPDPVDAAAAAVPDPRFGEDTRSEIGGGRDAAGAEIVERRPDRPEPQEGMGRFRLALLVEADDHPQRRQCGWRQVGERGMGAQPPSDDAGLVEIRRNHSTRSPTGRPSARHSVPSRASATMPLPCRL